MAEEPTDKEILEAFERLERLIKPSKFNKLKQSAEKTFETAKESVHQKKEELDKLVQENPITAIAIAGLAGAIIGSIIAASLMNKK